MNCGFQLRRCNQSRKKLTRGRVAPIVYASVSRFFENFADVSNLIQSWPAGQCTFANSGRPQSAIPAALGRLSRRSTHGNTLMVIINSTGSAALSITGVAVQDRRASACSGQQIASPMRQAKPKGALPASGGPSIRASTLARSSRMAGIGTGKIAPSMPHIRTKTPTIRWPR